MHAPCVWQLLCRALRGSRTEEQPCVKQAGCTAIQEGWEAFEKAGGVGGLLGAGLKLDWEAILPRSWRTVPG